MPQLGHVDRSDPGAGRNRAKQVKHRTSPSRGPSKILWTFMSPSLFRLMNL